jgi:[acyl-carrier-protein] S-malonyltransferase
MKKIGFIFPGQGSQSVGMGREFFENSPLAVEMISNASKRLGINFEELLFTQNDNLEQTQFTQPAILLVSAIANAIFKSHCNIVPTFSLGHSLGEFSALVSVGALDYLDAVELVNKRGLFMNEACAGAGAGMMALLGLEDKIVEEICETQRSEGKKVWPANYNIDGQLVLAGLKSDLESLVDLFKSAGAKRAIVLNMSVASHCPLLISAVQPLENELNKYLKDEFLAPVVSNVTTNEYNTKEIAIKLLAEQLTKPVLYKQSIAKYDGIVDCFIEFGNGAVLKGLNKKLTTPTYNVNNMETLNAVLEAINA